MSERTWSRAWNVGLALVAAVTWGGCGATKRDHAGDAGSAGSGNRGGSGNGATPGRGGATGAAGASGAVSAEPFAAPCFAADVADCSAVELGNVRSVESEPLLYADDVAPGARFTRLGGRAALIEAADGRYGVAVPTLESGGVLVRDIDNRHDGVALVVHDVLADAQPPELVIALGCSTDVGCHVLGANAEDAVLKVVPELSLPAGADVDALSDGGGSVCAFGNGLFCLDEQGRWRSEIPPMPRRRVIAADAFTALTDDNVVFLKTDGGWAQHDLGFGGEAILGVYLVPGGVAAVGAAGRWSVISEDGKRSASCLQEPRLLGVYGNSLAVDVSGVVYRNSRQLRAWCRWSTDPLPGLIAQSVWQCGIGSNLLAITPDAFYSLTGPLFCALD